MVEKAEKVCWISGLLQAAGVAVYLCLPFLVRSSENYADEITRGWNLITGFVAGSDVLSNVEKLTGISLLLLFICGVCLILAGLAGFITAWIKSVPPVFSGICPTLGLAADVAAWLYSYLKIQEGPAEYSLGVSGMITAVCMAAACALGYIATGLHVSANRKSRSVVYEKLPDVSEKMEEKKYYQVVEKEPDRGPRGVMVGLTGVYAGVEIPLQPGESVKIGRDATSNLIYDKSAPRISRHHCEITWNPQSQNYSIIDTSTNGTFKNGSEDCLPQNMRISLEIGCTISLGDDDNMFRLE